MLMLNFTTTTQHNTNQSSVIVVPTNNPAPANPVVIPSRSSLIYNFQFLDTPGVNNDSCPATMPHTGGTCLFMSHYYQYIQFLSMQVFEW
mmetsp:Transcript_56753/g.64213  ORF Transcript_56753/g.64213 Transcript_56753/m.64213 type:complete len:90 (-) Transcript_56753:399-668(-)